MENLKNIFCGGDGTENELDNIVSSLSKKEATIKLIMNMFGFFFKTITFTFKIINLVDSNGEANINALPKLGYDHWREIKDVLLYILLNYNKFANGIRNGVVDESPNELKQYQKEFLELSDGHLLIKQSFVDFSHNLAEVISFILTLVAINLKNPRNHISGEYMNKN